MQLPLCTRPCSGHPHFRCLILLAFSWCSVQRCRGLSIKSMQVWSQSSVDANGAVTWQLPTTVYAWNLETVSASSGTSSSTNAAGARASIRPWTSIGCYGNVQSTTAVPLFGTDPLRCTIHCDAAGYNISSMQGSTCSCHSSRSTIGTLTQTVRCDLACMPSYYNGTTRFCGGVGGYQSLYQKFDYVHQSAQGCYDPWRFLWYQSVAVEVVTTLNSVTTATLEWYLHAASINSGDPAFPYHQTLAHMLMGLQYDLDNSRLVGWVAPSWDATGGTKVTGSSWDPFLEIYKVNSVQQNQIVFTKSTVTFDFIDSTAATYLFSNGVSALDAIANVYYVVLPVVPQVQATGFIPNQYSSRLYGINMNTTLGSRLILNQALTHNVVLLECNAKYHDLYGLFLEDGTRQFYYSRLGNNYQDVITSETKFNWTFVSPSQSVVNLYSFQPFLDKYYQIGATTVDHVSNTSFVVLKDSPNADAVTHVKEINQRGFFNNAQQYASLSSPDVQATWLVNTDPMIPLSLPAPRLLWARFTLDGRNILVQFDSFTVEGALPIDSDGDFIPDAIDWTTKHIGIRNCSDMFARQTAALLGDLPTTACRWQSGTTIQIQVDANFNALSVGDGLFLKDATIYAYLSQGNEWSNAASGGISISLPSPLPPPTIDVAFPAQVDLCSSVFFNGEKSSGDGGRPIWIWSLAGVTCISGRQPTTSITQGVISILSDQSQNGLTLNGQQNISFTRSDLEPGCTYTINATLIGRWGLQSSSLLIVTKSDVPAPQAAVQGPNHVHQFRSRKITLQVSVAQSACQSLVTAIRTLRFEWTATVETISPFNGALTTTNVDLTLLNLNTASATLIIPRLTLTPDANYTMQAKVGYDQTWNDLSTVTFVSVKLTILRSPIKVNVLGGSRSVPKTNFFAIDARSSVDPDYPNDLVQGNTAWSFSYNCSTLSGTACFPLNAQNAQLPDLKTCSIQPGQTFQDLTQSYPLASFSNEAFNSDAYYCKHPTSIGVLIVNLPNTNALLPGNYTFIVIATAHGRIADASLTLEVIAGSVPAPRVLIDPLGQPKVPTTQSLQVTGGLVAADRAQFANTVVYSWSFTKEAANPRWSQQSADLALLTGQPYLIPPKIFIPATEFDVGAQAFNSNPNSPNLVVNANIMSPSSTYAFTLSATAPHPYGGSPLVGHSDLSVKTAGAAPVGGSLLISPGGSSQIDTEKTLTALSWSADDVPLYYMMSYKVGLSSQFPSTIDLRVASFIAPTQIAKCMKQGDAADNYNVEVILTVTSNFGASTNISQLYQSLPPPAGQELIANQNIINMANAADPSTASTILNCVTIVTNAPAPPPATAVSGATTQTTTAISATQQQANIVTGTAMINTLDQSSTAGSITASTVESNLNVAKDLANSGVVPPNVVDFVVKMGDEVSRLAASGESSETVDRVADTFFKTFSAIQQTTGTTTTVATTLSGGRRLHASSSYNALPDWSTLPVEYRDPLYATDSPARLLQSSTSSAIAAQEALEQNWLSYINATNALLAYQHAQSALDDEYFANYSAHLSAVEREVVTREWWEERARTESLEASARYTQAQITKQMFAQIGNVGSTLIKYMVPGQNQKNFSFPQGVINIGKTRDLINSSQSFHFQNSKWKIAGTVTGSYGYNHMGFDQQNPLTWAINAPLGPYLVNSLEVYNEDGTYVPVQRELQPLSVMTDHSSFASANCYSWDWQMNNGLGGWSEDGVLNNENGCVSTHLSVLGMFLNVIQPDDGIELPSALAADFAKTVTDYNTVVIVALCLSVVLCALLHLWGFKQDELDRTKPMLMKRLGDGITKPRSQDDPVDYSLYAGKRIVGTYWNLIKRDHILISCFCRCAKMKTTRLQKVSALFATISGTTAVCAVFYGEHVINSKHYIEIGIVAAVVTYPMIRMMRLMFSSRPFREAAPPDHTGIFSGKPQPEAFGPIHAMPVPDDELDDDDLGPPDGGFVGVQPPAADAGGGVGLMAPTLAILPPEEMSPTRAQAFSLPPVQAHSPGTHSAGSAPEEGGGPIPASEHIQASPAPPPPPAPVERTDDAPPLPPPPEDPNDLVRSPLGGLEASQSSSSNDALPGPPPLPPVSVPRLGEEHQLALLPSAPAPPPAELSPRMPPAEESGALELAQAQTQAHVLRNVRKMYIERVINESEKLAYDERIDMRASVPHPLAWAANALGYAAVISYWLTGLILAVVYSIHLSSRDALRWLYACLFSWAFSWVVLEGVKALLVTILELQQWDQRRRLQDHKALKNQVAKKKLMKMKQMEALAAAQGRPSLSLPSVAPPPLGSPANLSIVPSAPRAQPIAGDASAG